MSQAKNQHLISQVENYLALLKNGTFDHPLAFASALQALADVAWDEVDQLYQSAVRIDP